MGRATYRPYTLVLVHGDFYQPAAAMTTDLASKFIGSMVGGALGDAIGELAFRIPSREHLSEELDWRTELSYTDDTVMAIALARSLLRVGDVDSQDFGAELHSQYDQEPWRGYGPGPPTVFAAVVAEEIPYRVAAQRLYSGQGSFGNGAAMRAGPLGLFFYQSPTLYEKTRHQAWTTHTHPLGVDGAAVQSRAVALAVSLNPADDFRPPVFVDELIGFARTRELRTKLVDLGHVLDQNATPSDAIQVLGHGLAVDQSLPFALDSFLNHPRNFPETVFCATLHGGDRDTMGAMAGTLCGAFLGIKALPSTWRAKLEHRDSIEALGAQLAARHG